MSNEFLIKACRACLALNEKELFDWNSEGFVKGFNYAQCFQEVTQLSLSEDLPQMLCYDCAYELRITHSFIDRAHKADRKLRSCIKNRMNNELSNNAQEKSALCEFPAVDLALCGQVETADFLATNSTSVHQSCDSESPEEELVISQQATINLHYEEENYQIPNDECYVVPSDPILCDDILEGSKTETAIDSTSNMEFLREEMTNAKEDITEVEISANNSQTADASKKNKVYGRNIVCEACGAAFKTMSGLCRHESTKHNAASKVKQRKPRRRQPPQQCELCEEILPNKSKLAYHMQVKHEVRKWLCHACPSSFKSKSGLARHETIHGKREHKYCCDVCGIKCLSETILNCHMKTHDKNRKPKFACDECHKTFYVKSGLVMHKRLHSGDTFNCNVCHKALPRMIDLKVHLRTHSKERPYQCDICPLSFQSVSYLRFHKLKHEGVQFKCDVCDKLYKSTYSLEDHRSKHGEPLFQCQVCDKKFHKLKRHIRGVHQISTNAEAEEFVISLKGRIFKGRRYDPNNKAYNTLITKN